MGRTGCASCLFCNWLCVMSVLQLAVGHVCVATDRLNKSIITIIKYLIKQVRCFVSHRQRYWALFLSIVCQGREGEHSFQCNAEVKSEWSCNCTGV